jgi:hypothetical protein
LTGSDDPANDPSPVTLRLTTAPERDTLSPRERAVGAGLAGRGNVGGDDIAF